MSKIAYCSLVVRVMLVRHSVRPIFGRAIVRDSRRARLTNRDWITELSTDQFTEWRHKIPAYFYARTLIIFDVRRHPATRNAHISETIMNFVSNTEAKRTSAYTCSRTQMRKVGESRPTL